MSKQELLKRIKLKRNPELSILDLAEKTKNDLEKSLEIMKREMKTEIEKAITEIKQTPTSEMIKHITSITGKTGDKGDTPTEKELLTLINPLIPEPVKGDKGDSIKGDKGDSVKGEAGVDGKTPIAGVDFEIPKDGKPVDEEKIIKKVLKGIKIPKAKEIKTDLIKKLETKFKSLETKFESLRRKKSGGGGMGPVTEFSFTGDASTTEFTLPGVPTANGKAVWAYSDGQWLQLNTHYTISGLTLTTTYTPENGAIIEGFIIT